MLVDKKSKIKELTQQAIEIVNNKNKRDDVELKCVTSILSLITTIGSYAPPKDTGLAAFNYAARLIFTFIDMEANGIPYEANAGSLYGASKQMVEEFCNDANSI